MSMKPISSAISTSLKATSTKTTKPHTETGVAMLSSSQQNAALVRLTEAESPDKVTRSVIASVTSLIPSTLEQHTKDYDVKGYVIPDAPLEDLQKALMRVESSMIPLPMQELEQRLTALALVLMTGKDFDPKFMAAKRKALAQELVNYPADIVIAAFDSIKRSKKFWPTLAEFIEDGNIGWRYRPRKLLRDALKKKIDSV